MEINIELGKWLLDISKYLITALLLSTAFGDMGNPWIVMGAIFTAAITFGFGYFLLATNGKNKKAENIKKRNRNEIIHKKK